MYYNDEIKERYISECNLTDVSPYEVLFEKTCEFEAEKGKDLYDFNKKELTEILTFESTNSMQQLIMVLSRIRCYIDFALRENLVEDGQNHTDEIDTDVLMSCLQEKKIFSREEILHRINLLTNNSDKFIVLAVFEGIHGVDYQDLASLSLSDLRDGEVYVRDIHFPVSQELVDLAKETYEDEIYYARNNKKYYYDMEDTHILKRYKNKRVLSRQRMGKRIVCQFYFNIRDQLKVSSNISLKDILISGLIQKIKDTAERENKTEKEVLYDKSLIEPIEKQYYKIQSKINFLKRYF